MSDELAAFISDHAPIETQYGVCCRTCVDWLDAPIVEGGETEFGIAIPQAWPCSAARAMTARKPPGHIQGT